MGTNLETFQDFQEYYKEELEKQKQQDMNLLDKIGAIVDYLNPFSDNFILKKLWDFLTTMIDYLNPFSDNFLGKKIIELLGDLLQWLFIPEEGYFTNKVEEFKTALNEKIPYQEYLESLEDIKNVSSNTRGTGDITTSIDLNNYTISDKLTINMSNFIDFSIFSKYKDTWYSWIRVVVYIGLVIYNINETIKMFNGFSAINGSVMSVQNNINKGSGKK